MARIEKKTVTCVPSDENRIIDVYQSFGWTLDSSQEVYNKDSHLEGRRDGTYNVTETTNYVKLVFARDKDLPYYEEIANLETQFWSHENGRPSKPTFFGKLLFGFFVLTGILAIISGLSDVFTTFMIGLAFFLIPIIIKIIRKKKVSDIDNAETDILNKVKNYV